MYPLRVVRGDCEGRSEGAGVLLLCIYPPVERHGEGGGGTGAPQSPFVTVVKSAGQHGKYD